jgi:hypothetical protein
MRPSLRDSDIEAHGGQRTPKVFHPGEWVVIAIAIAVIAILIWFGI